MKGVIVHPPLPPAWANFFIMMEKKVAVATLCTLCFTYILEHEQFFMDVWITVSVILK
jgi:hypothetical protein